MTLAAISGNMKLDTLRERLTGLGYAEVDETTLDDLARDLAWLVLLPIDNPAQRPEFADLLVILPEILRRPGFEMFRVVFACPPASAALAQRFNAQRHPALIFLWHGAPAGVIEGLRDWGEYVRTFAQLRDAPMPDPTIATIQAEP
jgi:hydrogenase-1 operon protein HyaE